MLYWPQYRLYAIPRGALGSTRVNVQSTLNLAADLIAIGGFLLAVIRWMSLRRSPGTAAESGRTSYPDVTADQKQYRRSRNTYRRSRVSSGRLVLSSSLAVVIPETLALTSMLVWIVTHRAQSWAELMVAQSRSHTRAFSGQWLDLVVPAAYCLVTVGITIHANGSYIGPSGKRLIVWAQALIVCGEWLLIIPAFGLKVFASAPVTLVAYSLCILAGVVIAYFGITY